MCLFQFAADILAKAGLWVQNPASIVINRPFSGTPWEAEMEHEPTRGEQSAQTKTLRLQFVWPEDGEAVMRCFSDYFQRRGNEAMFRASRAIERDAFRCNDVEEPGPEMPLFRAFRTFNDLPEFLWAHDQEDYVEVKISSVNCDLRAFRVGYESFNTDGGSFRWVGPCHFLSPRLDNYGYDIEERLDLDLDRDEYLVGLRVHKCCSKGPVTKGGRIVGVSFVTTKRTVLLGKVACATHEVEMLVPHPSDRIVAFAGISGSDGDHIGFYAHSRRWLYLRPLVMLRWLVQNGRASFVPKNQDECTKNQSVLQALLGSPDDVWRSVVSFL